MKNLHIFTLWALMTATGFHMAYADGIDYQAMRNDGFGDVANLLQSMSPKQRADILQQASINESDLNHMQPEQLEQLREQLRSVSGTLKIDQVDPDKLDTSKTQGTADIQKNLDVYQDKFQQGKIHNRVVKSSDDDSQ